MNDDEFNDLTAKVANMLPFNSVDTAIESEERCNIEHPKTSALGTLPITIESNVWGWRIVDDENIWCEGLETLEDAIKYCVHFKLSYTVKDTQDPDPL